MDFGLHGLKEERTLRNAFTCFAWTTTMAMSAALAGVVTDSPTLCAADEAVSATQPSGSQPVRSKVSAGDAASAQRNSTDPPTNMLKKRRYFAALLDSARDDLEQGRLDLAQAKAAAARKLEVAHRFVGDKAAQVLAKIESLRGSKKTAADMEPKVIRAQSPSEPEIPSASPSTDAKSGPAARNRATQLLSEARVDFKAGRFDDARQKALKADEFDVKWDIFEDSPKTLLSQIEQHRNQDLSEEVSEEASRRRN